MLRAPRPPERPLKVLRIIDRLNVGGPALHAVLLSARMDPRRVETLLAYGDVEAGEGDMAYLLDEAPGLRAEKVPGLSRELRPRGDLRALRFLVEMILEEKPDVVHTHKTKAGLLGRSAAAMCGVPVRVHTYHGHVLEGYFGAARARAMIAMERRLAHLTSRLVTISPGLLRDLSGRLRIAAPERFSVVPLGLDLQPFRAADALRGRLRAELRAAPRTRLVGLVGRMVPIKDHLTFLRALALLDDPSVHAVLVGGGETEPQIRGAVSALGLGERVHLLGWRRDLPAIYADLDVLALTSRNEGTPVAVIEALCAGVPVVATAVGGVPDVLQGGRRGRLVPPGDPEALRAALRQLLDDGDARARAAEPARRDEVAAEYGIERLCATMADLYARERALAPAHRAPRGGARPGPAPRPPGVEAAPSIGVVFPV